MEGVFGWEWCLDMGDMLFGAQHCDGCGRMNWLWGDTPCDSFCTIDSLLMNWELMTGLGNKFGFSFWEEVLCFISFFCSIVMGRFFPPRQHYSSFSACS